MADDERPPADTPWGKSYGESEHIPGFWSVSTSRHGGLYLNAEQREAIPENLKAQSKDGEGMWWEEDCAWALPSFVCCQNGPNRHCRTKKRTSLRAHIQQRDTGILTNGKI